ncbi:hypothetical protein U1Q18_001023 [Sarracenia purpurea var. burkii]
MVSERSSIAPSFPVNAGLDLPPPPCTYDGTYFARSASTRRRRSSSGGTTRVSFICRRGFLSFATSSLCDASPSSSVKGFIRSKNLRLGFRIDMRMRRLRRDGAMRGGDTTTRGHSFQKP